MKRLTLALVIVVLAVMSLGRASAQSPYPQTITLYMPVEYIDEGALKSFERKYNVGVNLQEFESNEEMYENVIKSQAKYDVLVPSDYMVDRLIQEGRLAKLSPDGQMLPNAQYIAAKYLGPEYDPNNEYHMPYMVGTLGILIISGLYRSAH
jgi:spermidine/putrescine transport system substrate-binding protein